MHGFYRLILHSLEVFAVGSFVPCRFLAWQSSISHHPSALLILKVNLHPPNFDLGESLEKLGLDTYLEPISDLGYYGWKPQGDYRPVSSASAKEIRDCIDTNMVPRHLCNVQDLKDQLPLRFAKLEPREVKNQYPHGQTFIASLHVAAAHRGLDISTVDFMFGSYTLGILAKEHVPANSRCLVVPVPGTDLIMINRYCEYTQDYSSKGCQFERFAVGDGMNDTFTTLEHVVHLHLMKIGKSDRCESSNILLAGEADACDYDGNPIEIKTANPRYWGVKTIFQMISSSSLHLCSGRKNAGELVGVGFHTLEQIMRMQNLSPSTFRFLGKTIARNLKWLKEDLKYPSKGQVMELVSIDNKKRPLSLVPCRDITMDRLFPQKEVVLQLLLPHSSLKARDGT